MEKVTTIEQAIERYGEVVNGIWLNEAEFCMLYPIPNEIIVHNLMGSRQLHIYTNSDIIPDLHEALLNVISKGLASQLKTFDGCLNVRGIRGEPNMQSAHSWGLAIDWNAFENPLGQPGAMTDELAKCFTDAKFVWGKTFKRMDPMHMSWCGW